MQNRMFHIFVLITAFITMSSSVADRNVDSYHLRYMVKKEWNLFNTSLRKKAPKKSVTQWSARFTPPIPAVWPPKAKPKTIYYGYPGGINRQKLKRQEYRGTPWIKVTVNPDKSIEKKVLSNHLIPIEHQATWLKRYKSYHKVYKANASAPFLVANLTRKGLSNQPNRKKIRAYYCHWKNTEVISNVIKRKHWSFFKWLNCH